MSYEQGGSTQPYHQVPGASAPRPVTGPGPFAGVPARDYVTDVTAALLLLVSLAFRWDSQANASEHVVIVLLTVLSVLSLSLFYLARTGALPASWHVGTVINVRAAANLPFAILVVVYVVRDIVYAFNTSSGGGLGPALALGLVGVALAAMPRAAELVDPTFTAHQRHTWRGLLTGVFGLLIALQALAVVSFLVELVRSSDDARSKITGLVIALIVLALTTYVTVVPVRGARGGQLDSHAIAVALGAAATLWHLIAGASGLDDGGLFGFMMPSVGTGTAVLALLPAVAALLLSPALAPAGTGAQGHDSWLRTAGRASSITAGLAGTTAGLLFLLVILVAADSNGVDGKLVVLALLMALAVAAALVARGALVSNPAAGRQTALVATGVVVAMTIVVFAMIQSGASDFDSTTLHLLVYGGVGAYVAAGPWLFWIGAALPGLVFFALLAPLPVRVYYGYVPTTTPTGGPTTASHAPAAAPAHQGHATPPPPPPAPAPAPAPTGSHGFSVAQAADPTIDPNLLARIAQEAPELRPHVAANPAAYEGLVQWLGSLGDPSVDAALATRRP